jgi:murein L,D-transpeptidase YafK
MRIVIGLLFLIMQMCQNQAQENKNQLLSENKLSEITMDGTQTRFDKVETDSVADIKKGENEQSLVFIRQRLEALVGRYLREKFRQQGIAYPPEFILFRSFKLEKEFEVWAGNSRTDSLKKILLLEVCAVDNKPGTKLQEGDGKTPEGFYHAALMYGSANSFMWIKLNNAEIDTYGTVNYGSSFKICIDYPNPLDMHRTKTLLKDKNPGFAICLHANCVSVGCITFSNRDFLPVFLAALGHNQKAYGDIALHSFPFRFDRIGQNERDSMADNISNMKKEYVLETWANLEEAFKLFETNRKAIQVQIQGNTKYKYRIY